MTNIVVSRQTFNFSQGTKTTMRVLNNTINYECKRSNKNEYGTQKFWHVIFIIELLFIILSVTTGTTFADLLEPGHDNNDCSRSKSCTPCTEDPSCSWSLEKQTCNRTKELLPGKLTVRNRTSCPTFSLERKSTFPNNYDKIKVKISNDVMGFTDFLRAAKIRMTMHYQNSFLLNSCSIVGDAISSNARVTIQESMEDYFVEVAISFDGTWLRPDDKATNMFMAVYNRDCKNIVDDGTVDDDCVTCVWDPSVAGTKTNFLKWCSDGGQCKNFRNGTVKPTDGMFQVFKKDINDNFVDTEIEPGSTVPVVECADLRIRSIKPSEGPRTGGTTMEIAVKGHRIAVENANATVSVAGRPCVGGPKRARDDGETITCTVAPPQRTANETGPAEGPVEVVYRWSAMSFSLKSDQTFHFVGPA